MKLLIIIANFFARYSTPRWNKIRPLRLICRWCYRFIMETPAEIQCHRRVQRVPWWEFANRDTYPYRKRRNCVFAPWPECDEPGKYCLISDSRGAVIRRSVSYVLWKYHEATGRHLLLFDGGGHANDAKNWIGENGVMYLNLKSAVEGNFTEYLYAHPEHRTGHYIGVSPDEGEFGQLYWYEGVDSEDGTIYVSTYYQLDYAFIELIPCESKAGYITWYVVC